MTVPVTKGSGPVSAPSSLRVEPSIGRSTAVVSVGLLAATLLSAAQALLVLFILGPGESTDAFLSVYAVYAPFALLGATLRRSLVPLIGAGGSDEEFRDQASEVISRVVLYARIGTVVGLIVSPGAAYLITHGRPEHVRLVAIYCLLTLAVAAYFQLYGGALSGVLSAMSRYSVSAGLYVLGSAVAVGCSALLCANIGALGAALGVLAGSSFFAISHHVYLRRFQISVQTRARWLRERKQHRLGLRIVAGAALTAALQLNLAIALSAVGHPPGEATIYSYAYYIIALMLNLSAAPLSLVIMPSLVEEIARRGHDAVRARLLTVVPFAFFILVPLATAFATFGRPLLGVVFGHILSPAQLKRMYVLGLVLEFMLLFATLYGLAGSLLLALRKWRIAMFVALGTVVLQAAMVYPAGQFGSLAVAGAHAGATAVATLALLAVIFRGETMAVSWRILMAVAPAFLLALVFVAVRLPFGLRLTTASPSPYVACAAAIGALIAYLSISRLVWPRVAVPFMRVVGRRR